MVRPPRGPVILIGWDGADWRIIRPLVAAGRMPHLARLMARGAFGELRSYDPMFSPLIWTTIATGKAPTEHGIADFVVKDVSSGARRPITSDFRKVKALWNIFSDFDRDSAWLGWWASYHRRSDARHDRVGCARREPPLGGVDKTVRTPGIATPEGFLETRKDLLVPWTSLSRADVAPFFPVSDDDWRVALEELAAPRKEGPRQKGEEGSQSPAAFVCRVLCGTRSYHAIAKDLVRRRVPFVAVYYEGVDMMGHRFQHFLAPKMQMVSAADFQRFHDAVPRWYEYQDELLGDLLRRGASGHDRDDRVGSRLPLRRRAPRGRPPLHERSARRMASGLGHPRDRGPGIRSGPLPPASVYDVAPTLLYLEGLPLAEDMPGRVIRAAIGPAELASAAPRTVRSYELVGTGFDRTGPTKVDAAAMEEMMANLRALGYVGGDPKNPDRPAGGDETAAGESPRMDTQVYYHRNLAVSYIKQAASPKPKASCSRPTSANLSPRRTPCSAR
jgi:hypothetical protein